MRSARRHTGTQGPARTPGTRGRGRHRATLTALKCISASRLTNSTVMPRSTRHLRRGARARARARAHDGR